MPKLKCDVRSCIYNADSCCCRSVIKVVDEEAKTSDETACASFHRRKKEASNHRIYLTEFATIDGINQFVSIECESRRCKYNLHGICTAERVMVSGGSKAYKYEDTLCDTFIEK
ncbi:MAG TPA: DUF1540 domain-containing protein [Acholeplasmataceae bacterium]|nr:DUF1540 domain-containing protein [Acholeplasmataceae bacterium]